MDPFTMAIIASAAGTGGNIISTEMTNRANKAMASDQMDFQRAMSNTAHQREVNDLRAAGLNPILSAGGGNGATTPAGASANMVAPQIQMPDIMSYGVSMKQLEQAQQRLDIDAKLADATILKNLDERQLIKLQTQLGKKDLPKAEIGAEIGNYIKQALEQVKKPDLKKRFNEIKQQPIKIFNR